LFNVIPCIKSNECLFKHINSKFDLEELYILNNKYQKYMEVAKLNIKSYLLERSNVNYDMIALKCYNVLRNEKSSNYYQLLSQQGLDIDIFIIIDSFTGFIETNSNMLKKELSLYRGIDTVDIENKTTCLFNYLYFLEEKPI